MGVQGDEYVVPASVFLDTFLVNLSSLPGNLFTIFLLDRLGRRPLFFTGAILSALSVSPFSVPVISFMGCLGVEVLGIFFVATQTEVTILSCIFNATSVLCWNCMDAFSVELFPTEVLRPRPLDEGGRGLMLQVRATALGLGLAFARVGAILGNGLFGALIDEHCSIPILLVAAMLTIAGLASLKLKETTNIPLQ